MEEKGIPSSLLRFALEHSDFQGGEDGEGNEVYKEMDPEKVEFLKEVLKSDGERMREIGKIMKENIENEGILISCLAGLQEFVEDLDNANDMDHSSVDVLDIVIQMTSNKSWQVREASFFVLSTAMQNNPKFQSLFEEKGAHESLLSILSSDFDSRNLSVINKIVSCVSSFLKNNPSGQKFFKLQGGFSILTKLLLMQDCSDDWLRVSRKIVFLQDQLMIENATFRLAFVTDDPNTALAWLTIQKSNSDIDLLEKIQAALETLSSHPDRKVSEYIKTEFEACRNKLQG